MWFDVRTSNSHKKIKIKNKWWNLVSDTGGGRSWAAAATGGKLTSSSSSVDRSSSSSMSRLSEKFSVSLLLNAGYWWAETAAVRGEQRVAATAATPRRRLESDFTCRSAASACKTKVVVRVWRTNWPKLLQNEDHWESRCTSSTVTPACIYSPFRSFHRWLCQDCHSSSAGQNFRLQNPGGMSKKKKKNSWDVW